MARDLNKDFDDMDENDRIEYAQRTRHDIIRMFTHDSDGNKTNIISNEQGGLVRGLLKDMDSSIYTNRRLTVDEVSAEADKKVADMAERLMDKIKPMGRDKGGFEEQGDGTPEIDRSKLPKFELTEGEVEPVGNDVDLDEIARVGRAMFKGVSAEDED